MNSFRFITNERSIIDTIRIQLKLKNWIVDGPIGKCLFIAPILWWREYLESNPFNDIEFLSREITPRYLTIAQVKWRPEAARFVFLTKEKSNFIFYSVFKFCLERSHHVTLPFLGRQMETKKLHGMEYSVFIYWLQHVTLPFHLTGRISVSRDYTTLPYHFLAGQMETKKLHGMEYSVFKDVWAWNDSVSVNFALMAVKKSPEDVVNNDTILMDN